MAVRVVLTASAALLGLVLVALSPAGFLLAPLDAWIWRHVTLESYLLLSALSPVVEPIARAAGSSAAYAALGVVAAIGLTLATLVGVRLAAFGLSPASRAVYLVMFMWSLGLPLIVLIAMEQWMCIA